MHDDESGWILGMRRIAEAVILAMACLAPWAYGSVDAWAEFGLDVGVVAIAILGSAVAIGTGRGRHWLCLPSVALFGLTSLALLQATPLPGDVLRRIAPSEHASWASLVPGTPERIMGDPGPPVALPAPTLSQDPGATIDAAARLAAAWLLFVGVLGLGGGPAAFRRFALAIAGNAIAIALFSLVQSLTWNGKIYWIRPIGNSAWSVGGPFVNHSHMAEYLNLGLGFAMGFLLASGRDGPRVKGVSPWAAFASGLLVVGIITSHSRGGFLAMLASMTTMALTLGMQSLRRGGGRPWASPGASRSGRTAFGVGALASLALVGVSLFALGDSSSYRERLSTILDPSDDGYAGRMEIWREALGAWRDHPTWGTGLGSFASAAILYRRQDRGGFWSHAENEYIQMLAEGGIVGFGLALTALVAIVRLGRKALVAAPSPRLWPLVLGGLCGGLSLAVHSSSDFGLRIPGVGVAAVVLAAHLSRLGLQARGWPRVDGRRRSRGIGSALAGLVMVAISLGVAAHGWNKLRSEALLAGAGLPPPGSEMPTVGLGKSPLLQAQRMREMPDGGRADLPVAELRRMRGALEEVVRIRPTWAEGHQWLGLVYIGLYEQAEAGSVGGALDDPEGAHLAGPRGRLEAIPLPRADSKAGSAAGERLAHEPARRYRVAAARSFLEARRRCRVSALPHAGLAGLADSLRPGDPPSVYAGRALRLSSHAPTIHFLARVAAAAGDLDLAARCWKKSLQLSDSGWGEVADAAAAVLPPGKILGQVLPRGGRHALYFADKLYAAPEDREERDRFLRAAIERMPGDIDLPPIDRLWLESQARAKLGDRDRARGQMGKALAANPLRVAWRSQFVRWLIEWREWDEAHEQALIGTRLSPDDPELQRALEATVDAIARGAPAA